jgi:CBS domain containing-hemolysin-like protein
MQLIGMSEAPSGDYVTLAGFTVSQLHELPKPGDHFVWAAGDSKWSTWTADAST